MDWSGFEIDVIIEDYFVMLQKELSGKAYKKSVHRKAMAIRLKDRSEGSIEFKHQNISAVLIRHGFPYIKGYKPRWNYQQLLEKKILYYLKANQWLENEFSHFATQKMVSSPKETRFSEFVVPPPEPQMFTEPNASYGKTGKRNYLELEQKNQSIGLAGENLAYNYEIWRLKNSETPELAKKVEWISQRDDSAGFDILSKNADGSDIYIEVKSTTLGRETPIYFSKNENDFSDQNSSQYHLYRVFSLKQKPKMFRKPGSFNDICTMEAISYKGYF